MKNTVKVLCGLMAVCFGLSVFAGCRPEKPEETETEALPILVTGDALDINNDGEIDNKDVVVLFRKLSASVPTTDPAYDLNKDGDVNNKDMASLFQYLAKF